MKVSDIEALLDLSGTVKKITDKVVRHEILGVSRTHVIHGPYSLVVGANNAIRLFCPTDSTFGFALAPVTEWDLVTPNINQMALYLSNLPPKEIVAALERWEGIEAWLDSLVTLAKEQRAAEAAAAAQAASSLTEADLEAQRALEARLTMRRLE